MNRTIHRSVAARLLIALACLIGLAPVAAAVTYGDIEILAGEILPGDGSPYGASVLPIEIKNSGEQERRVELRVSVDQSRRQTVYVRSLRTSYTVGPGETVRSSVTFPNAAIPINRFTVYIDGQAQRSPVAFNMVSGRALGTWSGYGWSSSSAQGSVFALVSNGVPRGFVDVIIDARPFLRMNSRFELSPTRVESRLSDWPTTWRAFAKYACVVVSREEVLEASPAARQALRDYAMSGGMVIVRGPGAVPDDVLEGRGAELDPDETQERFNQPSPDASGAASYGYGLVFTIDTDGTITSSRLSSLIGNAIRDRTDRPAWINTAPSTVTDAERRMRIAPISNVPASTMFITLLLFTAIIGPLNIWLLSRWNRRTLLFVTVPVGGLLCSTLVFAIGLLSDGVTPLVRSASVVFLDQSDNRAIIRTHASVYAPLAPSNGVRFAPDDNVSFLTISDEWYNDESTPLAIDLSDGFRVTNGLVRSRLPAHAYVDAVRQHRERLEVTQDGGAPVVLNGLGGDVVDMFLHDAEGRIWRVRNLPAGEKATATPQGSSDRLAEPRAVAAMRADGLSPYRVVGVTNQDDVQLRMPPNLRVPRNGYVAVVAGSPFFDLGLDGADDSSSGTVVVGLLDDADTQQAPATEEGTDGNQG